MFRSREEFEAYLQREQERLGAIYLYQRSLATKAPQLSFDGTCAVCQQPTTFVAETANGEVLDNGLVVPNWRETLVGNCTCRLPNRFRAAVHFLEADVGLTRDTDLLLLGPRTQCDAVLARLSRSTSVIERLKLVKKDGSGPFSYRLEVPNQSISVAVSFDRLNHIPFLLPALAEVCRSLRSGGSFVFTVPFYFDAQRSTSRMEDLSLAADFVPTDLAEPVHSLSWDLFDAVRHAGFTDVAGHLYWSEEFGYLGNFNWIFVAKKSGNDYL
jgi:SAM-dependent methyltransferase